MVRSTASRRAKNSDSVITVPRLRVKSRRSLLSPRSFRSNRLRGGRLKLLLSLRGSRTRAWRTLTTVKTPSSSIVSPGVTPSPRARRRRRRLCVAPSLASLSSVVCSELSSSPSDSSLPLRRRPLPPRRRRRRNSSLSPSLVLTSALASTGAIFGALTALTVFVVGAA